MKTRLVKFQIRSYSRTNLTRVKMFKKLAFLTAAGILTVTGIYAATVPNFSFWDPTNATGMVNQLIGSINSNITPGSMAPLLTGRNALDNGDMWVNQRAATATCGTTTT